MGQSVDGGGRNRRADSPGSENKGRLLSVMGTRVAPGMTCHLM